MGNGNYESQILEAIQILVDDAVSKANYDKTIQGTISRCVDSTIGKYIVRYQDSSFYAYSHNTETTYPAGTSVYVLVPGNDMSKDKSIIGTVDHLGPDYVSIIEGENGYEVTGVNTINADGIFGLCSYKKEDIKILYDRDNNVDLVGLDVFGFENYIKKSNSIICGATFKTVLDSAQKYRGDYGIVFHLDFTDKSTGEIVTKSYIVNVDQMTGNPYNYTVASRQYGIFDVDGVNFISVKQIYLFAYDFPNTAEDKENDIFVSKVELSAANALDKEAAATCALTFVTPQGTYYDETDLETDIRTLQAQIRIKGNAIDNESQNVDYYWFRENNNITTKSEKYNQYGGAGWECLNNYSVVQSETEENEAVVQWARSGYQYITKKADNVARETTYKCVAVYFDGTILSKTIVIYNYSSNYEISIKSDSGVTFNYDLGKPTLTCYVNGQEETSDIYSYVWSVINSSNQFSILKQTTTENEEYSNAVTQRDAILAKISAEQLLTAADSENLSLYNQIINQYEYIMRVEDNKIHNLKISSITNFSTYKCSVYKSGVFIGTASIIITNTEEANPNYTLIIDNGNQIFKYNEKGVSPANGSNQTPQVIEPISFTLYDEKGQKINHSVIKNIEWKVPSSDTLLDVSLTHGNGIKNEDGTKSYFNDPELNISIAQNYNAHYDKNEIQLILTYNDKVISAKTNFTFVKEGESGTNGTDFVCKIIPNGIEGAVIPKYPTVIYNEYTQQYALNYTPKDANTWFKVQLWHDGELIFEGTQTGVTIENKEAEVQWMMLQNIYSPEIKDDSNFTIDKDTAAITFDTIEYNNPANIVKAVVRYNNVDYYATLPISIIRLVNEDYDVQLLDTSGFRHVMYTTDGQSPAFDNQPFELVVSQIVEGVKNDISQFNNSEFAVDYNWEVKGSVYYSDWQSELNLVENSLYKTKENRNQKYFKPVDIYNGLCVTNALVCHITREDEELALIHIPIHFYINRYGNAAMNGWDGNSISLDEKGGIILAPQIGAGSKNEDNTFTGVFMGSVKEPGAAKEEHGLFGYNAGQRTITLNSEDGSARFGRAGAGQIIIDPSTGEALLTSGNYDEEAGTGMEINLSEPSIKFGSGKFMVDADGNVTADSFATKDNLKELEDSINIFTVEPSINSFLIPCTYDQYPFEDKEYIITFTGKFKGKEISIYSITQVEGENEGIEYIINNDSVIFKVFAKTQIIDFANNYTIHFQYFDTESLNEYSATTNIFIGLAQQGKQADLDLDGIAIGNRNLLLNTDQIVINAFTDDAKSSFPSIPIQFVNDILAVTKGQELKFNLSIDIKVDGDLSSADVENLFCGIQIEYKESNSENNIVYYAGFKGSEGLASLNNEELFPKGIWKRQHIFFTINPDLESWENIIWVIANIQGNISTRRPQLVASSAETDWTIAIEDLSNAMDSLIIKTEIQYCRSIDPINPPDENAAWMAETPPALKTEEGQTIEKTYLWSRIAIYTKEMGENEPAYYISYACLNSGIEELENQITEYILSSDNINTPSEDATYTYEGEIRGWSADKPQFNIAQYPYLWTRLHSIFKTPITGELRHQYNNYSLDTSWNQLFSLTDKLEASVTEILGNIGEGFVQIRDGNIFIGDKIEDPNHVIIINNQGIAFFHNPDGGWPTEEDTKNVTSTWRIDGVLNMQDIFVENLTATDIANQNLVLGDNGKNNAGVVGDLDIYDKFAHIMFETVKDDENAPNFLEGFKIYKYKKNNDVLYPSGYIYLSRENGFQEYDNNNNLIFGNNGTDVFTAKTNYIEKQVFATSTTDPNSGTGQMIAMDFTNDGTRYRGIAFLSI